MDKYLSFEYFLKSIYDWYYISFPDKNPTENDNDLSILKCLKLLFLVTAAEIDIQQDDDGLLIEDTFNKFSALPLGHVESEIYSYIKDNQGVLTYFTLTKFNLAKHQGEFPQNTPPGVDEERIDAAVESLKTKNPDLIKMKAYELVDLTHKWASWRILYSKEAGSTPIPNSIIKSERKYFY